MVDVDPDLLGVSDLVVLPRGPADQVAHYAKCIGLVMGVAAAAVLAVVLGNMGLKKLAEPPTPATAPYQATTPTSTSQSEPRQQPSPPAAKEAEPAREPVTKPKLERPQSRQTNGPRRTGVDAEVALLRRAQEAANKDPARALALLEQHAREFPNGAFADVREVHRAEALCALGKRKQARAVARGFLRKYPGSHSAGRMRRICGDEEEGG
jgi:hypothetical protein